MALEAKGQAALSATDLGGVVRSAAVRAADQRQLRRIGDATLLDLLGDPRVRPPGRSLARIPDDADLGSDSLDFRVSEPSPGRANRPARDLAVQRGSLVLIRADGSEGDSFALSERTVIGRDSGGLFASDSYLSPRHATFVFGPQGLTVTDENSLNGVYLRIAPDTPTELRDRSIFRIGQEIIRFERLHEHRRFLPALGRPRRFPRLRERLDSVGRCARARAVTAQPRCGWRWRAAWGADASAVRARSTAASSPCHDASRANARSWSRPPEQRRTPP